MHKAQLLQAEIDDESESYFRFLVDGSSFKYITIAGGLFATDDLCFGPTLLPLLPKFPDGVWNDAYIDKAEVTGLPYFSKVQETHFAGVVTGEWCSSVMDPLDLSFDNKLRTGVYTVTSSRLSQPAVAKFARFEWEIDAVNDECRAYGWIEGQNIGPKLLALREEGERINGFVMEEITKARHAQPDDLALCRQTLLRLHKLGILHGDVNKHNFLIKDNRAFLIDFECAKQSTDQAAFQAEMDSLPAELQDTSGRGGTIVLE